MTFLRQFFRNLFELRENLRYRDEELRRSRVLEHCFSFLLLASAVYYFAWCIDNMLWEHWYAGIPFLMSEFVFLIVMLMWMKILWRKRFHRPEGPPLEIKDYSVDIFIPVCAEPVDIIEKTVSAAMKIDWERKTVYVLDDARDDSVFALCKKIGAEYIIRPEHSGSKGGNLNYAFGQTSGDLVLTLDADQVPEPEILKETIGYFSLPKIALVQTKQTYILPENDPWGNSDEVFYDKMMPGKDADNSATSCGNGALYRRKALETVDGFSTWNLVEDVHTTMNLHDKGWTSVYHNKSYTTGTSPSEVHSHLKQRWQWAVDSLRIFFWDNPFLRKGLSFKQKVQYFHFGFHYIAVGLFLPVFFILPIWALFSHSFIFQEPLWKYVAARSPYFLLSIIFNKAATQRVQNFKIFQMQAGLFWAYLNAVVTALFSRNNVPEYTVTSKLALSKGFFSRLSQCFPQVVLVILSTLAISYGIVTITDNIWFLMINVFWACWTISVLARFIILSLWPGLLIKWK